MNYLRYLVIGIPFLVSAQDTNFEFERTPYEIANSTGETIPDTPGLDSSTPRSELASSMLGDNTGLTLGEIRRNVFEAAGQRWAQFLQSNIPIHVYVTYEDLGGFSSGGGIVLASAGPFGLDFNFKNAPQRDVIYPISLANSLADRDLELGEADIRVTVNANSVLDDSSSSLSWYYGLDGNAPSGSIDMVGVIAHELGHGLGFVSLVNVESGASINGSLFDAFTIHIYDQEVGKYWTEMTNAERAISAANDPNLVFDGKFTNAAIDGVNDYISTGKSLDEDQYRIQLHAPSDVRSGSSVSHWSLKSQHALLMEPRYSSGLSSDLDLSPLFMKDIGWKTKDISIPHYTYNLWVDDYVFSTSSNPNIDDDGDGESNLEEYFYGTDPTDTESRQLVELSLENNRLRFDRSQLPNDLRYYYERSITLESSLWLRFFPTDSKEQTTPQFERVEAPVSSSASKKFYRLEIQQD